MLVMRMKIIKGAMLDIFKLLYGSGSLRLEGSGEQG